MRAVAEAGSIRKSSIVFAGRIVPPTLRALESDDSPSFEARPVTSSDLLSTPRGVYGTLLEVCPEKVSTLCSLLKGHNFGLMLAEQYLVPFDGDEREAALMDLISKLAEKMQEQRLQEMIRIQLRKIDGQLEGLAKPFLLRLALFLSPVGDKTLEIAFRETILEMGVGLSSGAGFSTEGTNLTNVQRASLDALMEELLASEMLFEAAQRRDNTPSYCVHATVRSQLLRVFHGQSADALPDFGLSGFLSGRIGVDPGPDAYQRILSLFSRIEGEARNSLGQATSGGKRDARNLCRDALGLLRSRMEANTAARWCKSYEEYAQLGIRTGILAKSVSPTHWMYREHSRLTDAMDDEGPLYLGELAWLYNDVALSLNAIGYLRDAYSVWEQAYEIGRLVESPETGSGLQVETLLSLAFCFMEMGRLPAARKILEEVDRANLKSGEVKGRITGLHAVLHHLHGNLPKADNLYSECLDMMLETNNLRARSFFSKQRADLKIALKDLDAALGLMRASRAMAEGGVFPDLVLMAQVTEGHLNSYRGNPGSARIIYNSVLGEARRLGLRKLEAECYLCLGRLAVREKDPEGGRLLTMKALSLANELGLGLRILTASLP
jgi:tetratricopeptide (TPR) repeat protein